MARAKLTKVPEYEEASIPTESTFQRDSLITDPELMKMVSRLSGYSKQSTERRLSLDVNALSINKRHSFVDKTGNKPTINVRNKSESERQTIQSHADDPPDGPKQKSHPDTRRSSVCLGTDLIKSHPSAFARSFTLSGNKFNYPSPMHAVLLQHCEHKLLMEAPDPETTRSPERSAHFENELHNILSQKPPNLNESPTRPPRRHSVSTTPSNHTTDGNRVLTSEFINIRPEIKTTDRCSRKVSSSSSGEWANTVKLQVLAKSFHPRRRKHKTWFETDMDSPLEKDEIDSETQSDNSSFCDNDSKEDSAIDSDATLHTEWNDITSRYNEKDVPNFNDSGILSRSVVQYDRMRRFSYQSEDSGAISGSCMSLVTSSSSATGTRRQASEDGYHSSNPNTPRSRYSYKSDISGFSTGSSYFAEDELSCDEQVSPFLHPRRNEVQHPRSNNSNTIAVAKNVSCDVLKTSKTIPVAPTKKDHQYRTATDCQATKITNVSKEKPVVVVYNQAKLDKMEDTFV
ncbi:uncharacterized protein LOC141899751 isoform X2 [Tubulanus polymorphus]